MTIALVVKNPPANTGAVRDMGLIPESGGAPREPRSPMRTISAFLPGESHAQRSLAGYNPESHKEQDMTEATLAQHTW